MDTKEFDERNFAKSRAVCEAMAEYYLKGRVYETWYEEESELYKLLDECGSVENIRKRLMPEGMEWPRFEDGEPVRFGDVVNDVEVSSVVFRDGGILLSDCTSVPGWGTWHSYKEPIKRPAVLAADGEPLEVGQTVWLVDSFGLPNEAREVSEILRHDRDLSCTIIKFTDGYSTDCGNVTHERPVLDADGVPIRVGDEVWCSATDDELIDMSIICEVWPKLRERLTVNSFITDRKGKVWAGFEEVSVYIKTRHLTHTKPEPPDSRKLVVDEIGETIANRIDNLIKLGRWSDAE